ncbi:unnamed protein product, partial [Amoebophrya sp. A25]
LLEEIVDLTAFDLPFASALSIAFFFGIRRNTLLSITRFGGRCDEESASSDDLSDEDDSDGAVCDPADPSSIFDDSVNQYIPFSGDFAYNARSKVFLLDLNKYTLKSNFQKRIYVRCLCDAECPALRNLCVHRTVPLLRDDRRWKREYIDNLQQHFNLRKTHMTRVGCLQHLMGCDISDARVASHLRWQKEQVIVYYNRGNEYKECRYKGVSFVPI